ncbi:ABC transporter substrate-binding protein [Trinickia mobilis]|uniref:ABC transporter substrate-binding protein n=1 Tax=Trinickia mobilis TaxID=2816356 RepID=UPI001A8C7EAA|nr:ABC transporter substrate-binding protein [Trinickia mobilis]
MAKLNPLVARVGPEYLLSELLYSGLTRLGEGMSPVPDLAESWRSNPELTVWTFKLRQGLVFHDGSACTSVDVVASFLAIRDAKTGSPGRQNVGPIDKVRAIDVNTIEFTLSAPYVDFPTALAFPNAKIVPAAVLKSNPAVLAHTAIGTGPFRLTSFHPDRVVTLARNDRYWDPSRPYLEGIELHVYPDPTAEGSALLSGDIDLMTLVQPTEFARLKDAPDVQALRMPSGQFCNVNMGCNQKPFTDVRVRQALALTVDRRVMVDFVAEGYGQPGNDSPISSAFNFYAPSQLKTPDIPKARQLLADAGYPNGVDLTLIASDSAAIRTQMAVAMAEMARPAGFRITVQTMPHATYLEQVWKKGAFYVGFYTMQPTVDSVFSLLYTSTAAWNETHWNNKAFDRVVFEARGTADTAKRKQLYAQAQEMMTDDVPSVIPVFFDILRAKRPNVQGYKIHPRGLVFRLDYVWLDDSAPARG